jgi:alpha,alpha-trehalase
MGPVSSFSLEERKLVEGTELQSLTGLRKRWETVDNQIRGMWDGDLRKAQEDEIRDPALNAIWYLDDEHRKMEQHSGEAGVPTLLFLPYPYTSAGGSESAFPEMYCWDIFFVNLALMQHGRFDIVRNNIFNHLFMIQRFGMLPTGNRTYYLTRSQTPLLAEGVKRYHCAQRDSDILSVAYPLLKKEYQTYWMADHHQTPTGLATNNDLGDTRLRPELAAEAESLDFTAVFEGDIRKCNPVQTNCALVKFARALEWMASELGADDEARVWGMMAEARAQKIRELNWDPDQGFYFEYQFEEERRLPYWSLNGYWALWAGVATKAQAARMVKHLDRFEHPYGLAHTDVAYPSPHPEFTWVQWGYPCGWPPIQMMVAEGLDAYGYHNDAERIAAHYLKLMIDQCDLTGKYWEKYNVVEGSVNLPRERTAVVPMHGWTTACAAWMGNRLFVQGAVGTGRGT